MGKNRLVTVETPKGKKRILYTKTEDSGLVCNDCPYNRVCKLIKDPRNPEDPEKTYVDFCAGLELKDFTPEPEESSEDSITMYHPVKGAIEDGLGKDYPDIIKTVIDSDPRVYVSDIIEEVCKGWCDEYTPERTHCNCNNMSCILRSLFLSVKKETEKPNEGSTAEGGKIDE